MRILGLNLELAGKDSYCIYKMRYFSVTPRLQMLFMSLKTVEHITLHHSHDAVDRVMVYPSDGEA